MRKVDGWQTLNPSISRLTLQPKTIPSCYRRARRTQFQPHYGRHRAGIGFLYFEVFVFASFVGA
jgi:hypothetical protein